MKRRSAIAGAGNPYDPRLLLAVPLFVLFSAFRQVTSAE